MGDKPTAFMVDMGNCIAIVKNTPSQVCGQCGDVSYGHGVAKRLERRVGALGGSAMEIVVVDYGGQAA